MPFSEVIESDPNRFRHNRSAVKSSPNRLLRLIAIFKLLKAALLLAVGVGALRLLHKDVASAVEHWAELLKLDPNNRYIDTAIEKACDITPDKIRVLGLGSMIYAGLFLTEGIGLWLEKRWAEWFTVIITSSLIPVEIYEISRRTTPLKIAVLGINLAIVAYLVSRIRRKKSDPDSSLETKLF
ncbi:MAG TPA: DUF2127 domain-containing protein [Terriglobales bacterium]|jgi:uncharacterized membrane protein (DUF2068 family)|nr:DUF2127 domain-containing protein [Terriglobales bacterium]